jgi:hypothetical protein
MEHGDSSKTIRVAQSQTIGSNDRLPYKFLGDASLLRNPMALKAALAEQGLTMGQFKAEFQKLMSDAKTDPRIKVALAQGFLAVVTVRENNQEVQKLGIVATSYTAEGQPNGNYIWTGGTAENMTHLVIAKENTFAVTSPIFDRGIAMRNGMLGPVHVEHGAADLAINNRNLNIHESYRLGVRPMGNFGNLKLSLESETAGVVLVSEKSGNLVASGMKIFNTVRFVSQGTTYPSSRQTELVEDINAVWNESGDSSEIESAMKEVLARHAEAAAQIVRTPGKTVAEMVLEAEAFSTETGVLVLDKSYRALKGTFVPFHTHLGHPESFNGMARFAPTAADLQAHRALMERYQFSHHTHLNIPGMILHASGEVTLFWASSVESAAVRMEVRYPNGATESASVFPDQLRRAETTGELVPNIIGETVLSREFLPGGGIFAVYHQMDLWDCKSSSLSPSGRG